jgi:hypothetical protein
MKKNKFKKHIFIITLFLSSLYLINYVYSFYNTSKGTSDFLKEEGFGVFLWLFVFIMSLGYVYYFLKKK